MSNEKKVVTRFAPSPTGTLHVGSARTALFNYLYAKKNEGTLILRIEDTDKERSKKEFEDDIIKSLEWLSLSHDEFYRQSERTEIYHTYLQRLIDSEAAYVSEEPAKDGSGEMRQLIRFKNPNKKVTFIDEVRGEVSFDTTELGDFVIAKDMNTPLYHFVVVVDDFEMGVTHVIRGEDHISNTPRQILIQEAIGAARPVYVHIPLILAEDRSKLSKRNGARSITEFKKDGFLPSALNNFLALIGWNPGDDREIFSLNELVKEFSLKKIQKSGAIFNVEKLLRINKAHMLKLDNEILTDGVFNTLKETGLAQYEAFNKEKVSELVPLMIERVYTFGELLSHAKNGEYDYYFTQPDYTANNLLWKNNPDEHVALEHLAQVRDMLDRMGSEDFNKEAIKALLWDYAEEKGRGDVLWPLRYALSGKDKSPDPFTLLEVLGKDESKKRIQHAIKKLS